MANLVHLWLILNGEAIAGEGTEDSLGREDTIECLYFEDSVRTARDKATGIATGRRSFEPLKIKKRIDKSSPLIARALCNNEVAEGKLQFYKPAPSGDGTTIHCFSTEFKEGRISSITRVSPDVTDPASAHEAAYETIEFVFGRIIWTDEVTGAQHEDSWKDA